MFIDKTIYKQKETLVVNSHMITPYNLRKTSTTYDKFNMLRYISWGDTFWMWNIKYFHYIYDVISSQHKQDFKPQHQ